MVFNTWIWVGVEVKHSHRAANENVTISQQMMLNKQVMNMSIFFGLLPCKVGNKKKKKNEKHYAAHPHEKTAAKPSQLSVNSESARTSAGQYGGLTSI